MEAYTKTSTNYFPSYQSYSEGYYFTTPKPGVKVVTSGSARGTPRALNSTINGFKNPKWKEQVRRRNQAGTPCSGTIETVSIKGSTRIRWFAPFRTGAGQWGPAMRECRMSSVPLDTVLGGSAASLTKANNEALTKLYGRIDSVTSGLKSLVAAGEMAETVRMLRTPTKALWDGLGEYLDDVNRQVKSLKRNGRIKNRAHFVTVLSGIVAGLWLERQFGWKPLISDIESTFDSLTLLAQRGLFPSTVVRSQSEAYGNPTFATSDWSTAVGGSCRAVWNRNRKVSVRYIACVSLEPRVTWGGAVRESFGVELDEFLPTLWELLPYSFLIDYVTNIGDIVSSSAVNTSRVKWVVKTTRSTQVNTLESVVAWPLLMPNWTDNESRRVIDRPFVTYEKGSFTRELVQELDTPSLEFTIPDLQSAKWLNVASLLRTSRFTETAISNSLKRYRS